VVQFISSDWILFANTVHGWTISCLELFTLFNIV
jgi:hypothetical protein